MMFKFINISYNARYRTKQDIIIEEKLYNK